MKRILSLLLVLMLILTACGGGSTNTGTNTPADTPKNEEKSKVMKEYTTVFDTEVTSLDYLVSSLTETREIAYVLTLM